MLIDIFKYIKKPTFLIIINVIYFRIIWNTFPVLRTLFHIKGAKFFKKGQNQGSLKQLNSQQDPGHDTR